MSAAAPSLRRQPEALALGNEAMCEPWYRAMVDSGSPVLRRLAAQLVLATMLRVRERNRAANIAYRRRQARAAAR